MAITTYLPAPDTGRMLFARTLARAYRLPRFIPDPAFYIQHDAEALAKAERDAVCAQVMQHRRHLVAGTQWACEPHGDKPEDKDLASLTEEVLREITNFESARFNLADAVFSGSRFAFQRWVQRPGTYGDGKRRSWLVCDELRDVDRMRVRLKANTDRRRDEPINVWMEVYSPQREVWVRATRPEVFVWHVYGDGEANLGYGNGLLNALYNTLYAKENVWEQGLQGLERWAQGILIASVDGAAASKADKTNDTLTEDWKEWGRTTRSEHFGVIDSRDKVEAISGASEGWQQVQGWLNYLDGVIRTLVLGANLTTSASEGGSYALANVQQNSTEALIRYDRTLLGTSLSRGLIPNFVRFNMANLREMGLDAARPPRITISQETVEDPAQTVQVVASALSAGIPLRKEDVYRKIGFAMPSADDEVFTGVTANGAGGGVTVPLPSAEEVDAMLAGDKPKEPVGASDGAAETEKD